MNTSNPIVLFDGVCNLCNKSVQLIIKKDKKKQFYFASLQGKTGQALLKKFDLSTDTLNSFVLIEENKMYTQSTAALRIFKKTGGLWIFLYGLIIVPPFIRDAVYRLISKNRYKWFGKMDSCMIPTPELKERFLE